ncbi:hypothetical protein [Sphingomonas colocasiae]|uniref:Uncharacterized protein n=1 Tax=Sphingomonas colocasiae TaxID=1848973 RepID=A0ABS7PVA3_9SPHN|nr:hypothetical protein [Sphingomonas colocasiae]MBY8825295.1 hypothetical protein [Sphingomonas colocasiae]
MHYPITLALLAAGTALAVAPSAAQAREDCAERAQPQKKRGLGGLLSAARSSGVADSILGAAVEATGDALASGGCAERPAETGPSDPSAKPAAAAETATATERARRRMAENDARYPSRMTIAEEWKTAKAAYDAFGKVRCTGCEGGYTQAGWIDWPRDEYSGKYNGAETRLSRLPIGHVQRWNSNGFAGTLTIDGEEQVNGFRCRKMTYRIEKDGQSAARPGLICWGKANEYAGSDSWVGVF